MIIKYEDIELDKDFSKERAEELGLFRLKLELPEGLQVTGYEFNNSVLIRRTQKSGEAKK